MKVKEDVQFSIEDIEKPIALVGLDGTVSKVNAQFMNVFGTEEKSNIEEVISGESLDIWGRYFKDIKEKKRMTVCIQVYLKHSQVYKVKVNLFFCQIEEKVTILFNIPSSLKKDKEKHNSIAFRKSDNLMIVANLKGFIEDVNDLTVNFFDLPREYFIGKTLDDVFRLFTNDLSYFNEFKEKVITGGHPAMVQEYTHSSEGIKHYKIEAFYVEDSNSVVMRITDYTEKAILKRELESKDSLAEVGQLAASIAHEIRNPMTTLKGFTQLLKATATEETLKYLTVIDDEILRMESILSEMLFLAKPNVHEKKIISVNKLFQDIIDVIYPKAKIEGIKIVKTGDFGEKSLTYGDEGKLKQVLLNLLKNALESMKPGGTLRVAIGDGKDNHLNLTIEDTGKGMDADQLKKIFSPYFTTRATGTGLGLPFVLKTIEDHGGTIAVTSEVNIGSKFVISIPQVKEKTEEDEILTESVLVN